MALSDSNLYYDFSIAIRIGIIRYDQEVWVEIGNVQCLLLRSLINFQRSRLSSHRCVLLLSLKDWFPIKILVPDTGSGHVNIEVRTMMCHG